MSNSDKISGSGEGCDFGWYSTKGKKVVPGNEIIIIIQGSANRKKKISVLPFQR